MSRYIKLKYSNILYWGIDILSLSDNIILREINYIMNMNRIKYGRYDLWEFIFR